MAENNNTTVKRTRGNPAMFRDNGNDDAEKLRKKMVILAKLNELERRRGIPKFNSVEEMQLLIENYFSDCAELQIRPTIRGLASALGTVYTTLQGWERGERDGQLGNSCSCIIKKAKQFIAEYDEMLALEGIDNPILFMFRGKNYYGMTDRQEIAVAQADNHIAPSMNLDQIAEKVKTDIPIDEFYEDEQ